MSRIDITGQRFSRLVALEPTNEKINGSIMWLCRCDCGKLHKALLYNLTGGRVKSCGCLRVTNMMSRCKVAEAWRYERTAKLLDSLHIEHEFEFMIADDVNYIYDLCLPYYRILVEFDGPSHGKTDQKRVDVLKDKAATEHYWLLFRIKAEAHKEIDPYTMKPVLEQLGLRH